MKYPLWKPILIVAVLGLFAWILTVLPLRKGLDLAGGTTLIYDVRLPEDAADPAGMIDDMIDVLRDRIDPGGIRNLQWRRIAGNRIEIQMALAGDEVKELRDDWITARDALLAGNVSERDLDAALRLAGGEREARLTTLAAGHDDLKQRLTELAAAHDALTQLREPYQQLQQQLRDLPDGDAGRAEVQGQLTAQARKVYEAQRAYQQLRDDALASNVTANELQRVLDQANVAERKNEPTKRQAAADELKQKHPSRVAEIDTVLTAYAAYETRKGPLDDPNDLIAMLRGSGVLEFRIAATFDRPADGESYRQQLHESGPRGGAGKPWRWFPVDDIEQFADTRSKREALEVNPAAFFLDPSRGSLIGDRYGDEYYILLADTPDLAMTKAQEWQLTSATRSADQLGKPAVAFATDARGAALMGRMTGDNVGRPMAILLDGHVMSAPNLRDRIRGNGIITGDFTAREIDYLVRTLKAGSTEAELGEYPISIKTTGPALGQDNLKRGLEAGYIAFAITASFMLVYYFLGGVIANVALMANILITLGIMAMFEATFTLPGIAGVVLTIGMAVDANVLIFERVREELERGADLSAASRLGHGKAFAAIFDSNLTTFITAWILAGAPPFELDISTAEVKGFGITLMVGIIATMFSSVFMAHVLFEMLLVYGKVRRLPMLPSVVPALNRFLRPNINWVGKRRLFLAASTTLSVIGLICLFERGADMLDIEFRSGTQVSFNLSDGRTLSIEDVRQRLATHGKAADEVRAGVDPSALPADERAAVEAMRSVVANADERHARRLADEAGEAVDQPVNFDLLADAVVVTEGDSDGLHASAFNVATLITDAQAVSDTIKAVFGAELDAAPLIEFAQMNAADAGAAPVYVVRSTDLGDNINRPDVRSDVAPFVGGVAVVLDDLQPAATVEDLTRRIAAMRLQPAYEGLGFRRFSVVGLDAAAEGRYRSAAVVVQDETTDYAQFPDAFDEPGGLADTEWQLVRDALTRDTSLASVSNFSSQVSSTMKQQALVAMVLSLLAMVVYIWFRFGSIRWGLAAVAALAHDVTIALGMLAIGGWVYDAIGDNWLMITPFKINLAIVAAILTLIGYSLNDKIVVFDRIRENRGRLSHATPGIVNDSINQTISRTILTGCTTLASLVVLYVVGGPGVHGFAYAMFIGVLVGTYSSIAVAAPLLLLGNPAAKAAAEPVTEKAA